MLAEDIVKKYGLAALRIAQNGVAIIGWHRCEPHLGDYQYDIYCLQCDLRLTTNRCICFTFPRDRGKRTFDPMLTSVRGVLYLNRDVCPHILSASIVTFWEWDKYHEWLDGGTAY